MLAGETVIMVDKIIRQRTKTGFMFWGVKKLKQEKTQVEK